MSLASIGPLVGHARQGDVSWQTATTLRWGSAIALAIACAAATATAVEMTAGDWKFTANGNVNVHYIGSSCEDETTPAIAGGLACRGAAGEDKTSSISNGLLPAALAIGASTTQNGYDLAVTFGFYPGYQHQRRQSESATRRGPDEYGARDRGHRHAAGFPDVRQGKHGRIPAGPKHRPVRRRCDSE